MIRRSPNRIELKLEDLSEFLPIRREFENLKEARRIAQQAVCNPSGPKIKQENIGLHERIGVYVPQPRPYS